MASPPMLSVLIIGCGNIAGGFDRGRDPAEYPFTHAGAYRKHGGFQLAACVEPDAEKRDAFMRDWDVPLGFASVTAALSSGLVCDVVSVCSPTVCHADDVLHVLEKAAPRLIFCEKPVTGSLAQTAITVARCEVAGVSLAINHNRRWDPAIAGLRDDIQSGRRGALRSVVGFYNKGILNNGSHMFDLLRLLLGELEILSVGLPVEDYSRDDPTLPVWMQTQAGVPVFLACGDARDYALFELQLVFSTGVIAIEDGGQAWRERTSGPSAEFSNYHSLTEGRVFRGADDECMLSAVDNIYRNVLAGDALSCTGRTALAAQELCERAKLMAPAPQQHL